MHGLFLNGILLRILYTRTHSNRALETIKLYALINDLELKNIELEEQVTGVRSK